MFLLLLWRGGIIKAQCQSKNPTDGSPTLLDARTFPQKMCTLTANLRNTCRRTCGSSRTRTHACMYLWTDRQTDTQTDRQTDIRAYFDIHACMRAEVRTYEHTLCINRAWSTCRMELCKYGVRMYARSYERITVCMYVRACVLLCVCVCTCC